MRDFTFSVTPEALDLGVKIIGARVSGIQNSVLNASFEEYKGERLKKIFTDWQGKNYKDDEVLQGFRELHTNVGRSNRDYIASPEALLSRFVKNGVLPQINTVVDIYNLVSIESRLALGAHDLRYVKGNITLRLTDGTENFLPLGSSELQKVFPNEYAYVDDGNNIVCRMEVLQVEPTKVSLDSTDLFLIIQGNGKTELQYVIDNANLLGELITKYCGGDFQILK